MSKRFQSRTGFGITVLFYSFLITATLFSCKSHSQDSGQDSTLKDPALDTPSTKAAAGKEKYMIKWSDVLRFAEEGNPQPDSTVVKSDAEWRKLLTPDQYRITRQKETERAFSSEMCSLFEPGLYACICCHSLLFDARQKFESGTGWPSFTQPIKENVIAYHSDTSYGMQRIEVLCNTCGAHLGHVFPDGPGPGGLRFCINALSLEKIKK